MRSAPSPSPAAAERGVRFGERTAHDEARPEILLQFADEAAKARYDSRIRLALAVRGLRIHAIEADAPEWKLERCPATHADWLPSPDISLPD